MRLIFYISLGPLLLDIPGSKKMSLVNLAASRPGLGPTCKGGVAVCVWGVQVLQVLHPAGPCPSTAPVDMGTWSWAKEYPVL